MTEDAGMVEREMTATPSPTVLPLGIHPNIPFADYLAQPGINSGLLRDLHQFSPAHALVRKSADFRSDATDLGSAFHCAVLEPAEFDERFYVRTPGDGRKKDVRIARAQEESDNQGKTALDMCELDGANRAASALKSHPLWSAPPLTELSIMFDYEGIRGKARLDGAFGSATGGIITDLKSTSIFGGAEESNFTREIFFKRSRLLWMQAAWYSLAAIESGLCKRPSFRFFCVELVEPYGITVHEFDHDELAPLRGQCIKLAMRFTEWMARTGPKFPYAPMINTCVTPPELGGQGEEESEDAE